MTHVDWFDSFVVPSVTIDSRRKTTFQQVTTAHVFKTYSFGCANRPPQEIDKLLLPYDPDGLLVRLQTIPGVGNKATQIILAEIATDMSRFPSAGHLAAWADLVPDKNESSGRNRPAKTNKANRYLRRVLIQAGQAVGHTRDSFLAAHFHCSAARHGKQQAAMAIARSILAIVYHIIAHSIRYVDLA